MRALIDAMHDEVLEQVEVGVAQHNRRVADGSYLDHSMQPCRDAMFAPGPITLDEPLSDSARCYDTGNLRFLAGKLRGDPPDDLELREGAEIEISGSAIR